tara:strand:+ start:108 stop:419 length:312 start_codon:yes stop_codon:yes gene_type:complete
MEQKDMGSNAIATGDLKNESDISRDIKIQSEVEKIWINYDADKNGTLELNEVKVYLNERCKHIPENAIEATFNGMDLNNDGHIDKEEMFVFVKNLMFQHHMKK